MKSIYIYPSSDKSKSISKNPYIADLYQYSSRYWKIINGVKHSKYGIFDLLSKINQSDLLWLNWIENLPDRKFGILQSCVFILFLYASKILKINIIYTVHNIVSHSPENFLLKRLIQKLLVNNSKLVITHSSEGLNYIRNLSNKQENNNKWMYFPHPTKSKITYCNDEQNNYHYDIILWGSIYPYKGIKEFLEYLYETELQEKYKILIIGKISDFNYGNMLKLFKNRMIEIKDEFLDNNNLQHLLSRSKVVLFTHNSRSVLSSGGLVETLRYHDRIVGPNKGEFKDLSDQKIIKTYNNYEEMISHIDHFLYFDDKTETSRNIIKKYLTDNTWDIFMDRIKKLITFLLYGIIVL